MERQRITGLLIACAVGVALAVYAYRLATDAATERERQREEAVVACAREILGRYVGIADDLEIVDPLNRNPVAGKAYVYPADDGGWQVSGHYRRPPAVHWRPWLMTLDAGRGLEALKVRDDEPRVRALARIDPRFDAGR